jgi:hypothetical protein
LLVTGGLATHQLPVWNVRPDVVQLQGFEPLVESDATDWRFRLAAHVASWGFYFCKATRFYRGSAPLPVRHDLAILPLSVSLPCWPLLAPMSFSVRNASIPSLTSREVALRGCCSP